MNKLILICLLFVVPTAFAVSCTGNTLIDKVGLTPLSESTTATTLTYCQGLETLPICCSADTINSIQTTIDALTAEVIINAAARDTYLLSVRTAVAAAESSFQTLQTTAAATLVAVKAAQGESTPIIDDLEEAISNSGLTMIYSMIEAAIGDDDAWTDYQKARATCANKVLETQASAYCLACRVDPTATATFATTSNENTQLAYTDNYGIELEEACAPYLIAARTQNMVTAGYLHLTNVAALNTLLTTIGSATAQMTQANLNSFNTLVDITPPTDEYNQIPDSGSCTISSCDFIFTDLLAEGVVLNTKYLAHGGEITSASASSSRRVLASPRMLAPYDPTTDDNKSGVTVDFPTDVIAAASAWRQGGLMTCVVALVAMLLF